MVEDTLPFSGDTQRAFDIALRTLQPLGFDVTERSSSRLVVVSSGFDSTHQNALLGISRAETSTITGRLTVKAELGGVDRFQKKMMVLMIGAGLFDSLLQLGLWFYLDDLHAKTWFLVVPVLTFIPWIFFAPYMARWILSRTKEALNSLLSDMAAQA